jgi:hypothetical protein
MIKEHLPHDHNHTHYRHSRTLWEAFQGRGDMYLSEPPLISPEDKYFVVQLVVIGILSIGIFLIWG